MVSGEVSNLTVQIQMAYQKNKKSFIKNTLTLTSGNIGSQIIKIALVPVVTRLFPPDAFGAFSTITAIVMIISSVSHLRYNVAIQLPQTDLDADSVTILSLFLVVLSSMITLIIILIFWDQLVLHLGFASFAYILLFIPLGIMIRGIVMIFNQWHLRYQAFSGMSKALIYGAVGDRIVTVSSGLLGTPGPGGLLSGRYCGMLLTNLLLFFHKGTRRFTSVIKNFNYSSIKKNAIRYKQFPKYSWSELFQQATNHLPVIMLAFYFNQTIVGYFALTRRVLSEPLLLVGQALSRSFFQKTSELHREKKDVTRFTLRTLHFLCLAVIFPMLFVGVFAEELFGMVFGKQWIQAGLFTQLMVPFFILDTITRPIRGFFDVLIKQKERMIFNVVLFSSTTICFVTGGVIQKTWFCLVGYSVLNSLIIFYMLLWLAKQIKLSRREAVNVIGSYTLKAILAFIPLILAKQFIQNTQIQFVIGFFVCSIYILYYRYVDNYMSKELSFLMRK